MEICRSKEAGRLKAFPLVTLGSGMIDLEDFNRPSPRRLPEGERIEASTQDQVLLDRALCDGIGEAVLSVPASHYKARTHLLESWLAGFEIQVNVLGHLRYAQSDGIEEDLRLIVE